jgi:hypothetical protein
MPETLEDCIATVEASPHDDAIANDGGMTVKTIYAE